MPDAPPPGGHGDGTADWVRARLGVQMRTSARPLGVGLEDLLGLAVRRNPRRAHLLVSRVLGKHVPTDPRLVRAAGLLLGALVREALDGKMRDGDGDGDGPDVARHAPLLAAALRAQPGAAASLLAALEAEPGPRRRDQAVVLGFAETATALGHAVADALPGSTYLHSTRRTTTGVPAFGVFEEEHSHATFHLLLPADPALLTGGGPLVLVDDEVSTGRTVRNVLTALHEAAPRDRYVLATLVDLRSPADRAALSSLADRLGVRIDVVALAGGSVDLPDDVLARGTDLVERTAREQAAARGPGQATPAGEDEGRAGGPEVVRRVEVPWPADLPEGGRHGVAADRRPHYAAAADAVAAAVALQVPGDVRRLLVLGTEELMHTPLLVAGALARRLGDADVRSSTTTRSPVLPVDDAGYAIRTRVEFPAHDGTGGTRYAYNVAAPPGQPGFDVVVLVVDDAGDSEDLTAPGGLLDHLSSIVPLVLLVRVGPAPELPPPLRGPEFGSYAADEVAWLLTDLSHVALEAPVEEREEAIQAGGAHYAESLPVEYQPTPEYQELFRDALSASARRLAYAVGVVTELVLAERGPDVVLVSLARAGTPVGILMRRWAQLRGTLKLGPAVTPPHYAVSIVRGKGIDPVALRFLASHHDPADVMFVDGWTGKGAISRELAAALDTHAARHGDRFGSDLAVVADPGGCTSLFGTREDYLIASACLNSTVSGLVSRTVLNDRLIGPGQFHGAKFYAELSDVDVSGEFLDAVTASFASVAGDVVRDLPAALAADRSPTWAGWAAVERISSDYGIHDVNLVKPGVGETTRVLLRRVPWKVLVRAGAEAELGHVRLLAAQRGVPVETVDDLPYSCVGLIHPRFTRGATGADGAAVRPPAAEDVLPVRPVGSPVPVGSVVTAAPAPPVVPTSRGLAERGRALGLAEELTGSLELYRPPAPVPAGRAVVACDLDRTLVYSARALGLSGPDSAAPRLVVSEVYEGVPLSFMTRAAELVVAAIARAAVLVPSTTRTRAQYERIAVPGPVPAYAITTNGGQLLVDGAPDAAWGRVVRRRLAQGSAPLAEIVDHLAKTADPVWTRKQRVAEDLFTYLVVERDELPASFVPDLTAWCTARGWTVSLQGRKVYCVPEPLSKAAALEEVMRRTGADWSLAAGDSLLDTGLMLQADLAVRPAHGELHDLGWHAPHLTVTGRSGVLGGEEVALRLLAAVLSADPR